MAGEREPKKVQVSIEATAATLLLIVMTAMTLLLISTTGRSYRGIVGSGAASQQLRTGLMFVSTKIRQADSGSDVSVRSAPSGGNAVVVTRIQSSGTYENWIFFYKGAVREATVPKGAQVNPDACAPVANLSSMTITQSGQSVTVTASTLAADKSGAKNPVSQSVTLSLRG
jgi:hypothetical protein